MRRKLRVIRDELPKISRGVFCISIRLHPSKGILSKRFMLVKIRSISMFKEARRKKLNFDSIK